MYMHIKIPWERIRRMVSTPRLLMSRDYYPRFYPYLPPPSYASV